MILRDDSNLTQTITLKKASENKIKLRVTGYYKGKNICIPFQEVVWPWPIKSIAYPKIKKFWGKELEL